MFATLSGYVGSAYVTQFNKFGRTFQVYVQAAPDFRLRPEDIETLYVKAGNGTMVPLGTLVDVKTVQGPSLISLYNLYPTATIVGGPAPGHSSGQALELMEQVAKAVLPPGTGYDWTAMSYQEKAVGTQIYLVFALAIVLVYFVLAGQYESWIPPLAVLLGVPLALLGTVGALSALDAANNLYTQIGLILLIALASKNAILIVEVARERRQAGAEIATAAIEAARLRFRPILMTSFAFILGVLPLVTATGAGASARKSIGITVFSGMLASTCLAVLFVPSFYVVLQRFEDWRSRRRQPTPTPTSPPLSRSPPEGSPGGARCGQRLGGAPPARPRNAQLRARGRGWRAAAALTAASRGGQKNRNLCYRPLHLMRPARRTSRMTLRAWRRFTAMTSSTPRPRPGSTTSCCWPRRSARPPSPWSAWSMPTGNGSRRGSGSTPARRPWRNRSAPTRSTGRACSSSPT